MTFGHDDIRERLVEFLYDELEGPDRAAFDAHLAGCSTCRAETEATRRARGVARAVVRAPLGDPLPLGLRARVLEVAASAARERAAQGGAAAAPAGTHAAPTSVVSPRVGGEGGTPVRAPEAPVRKAGQSAPGWLDRLRGRWTLPTFATVGALAAFLLVRGMIFREARRPLGEAPAERLGAPAPGAAVAPTAAPTAATDRTLDRDVVAPPPADSQQARAPSEPERHPPSAGVVPAARDAPLEPAARSVAQGSLHKIAAAHETSGSLEGSGSGASAKAASRPARRDSTGAGGPSGGASSRAAGVAARKVGDKKDDRLDDPGTSSGERRSAAAPTRALDLSSRSAPRRRAARGDAMLDGEPSPLAPSLGGQAEPEADLQKGTAPSSRDEGARFAQPPPAPPRPARAAPAPTPSASAPPAAASAPSVSPAKPSAAAAPQPPRPASAPAPSREDRLLSAEKKAKRSSADKAEAASEQVEEGAAAPTARAIDPALAPSDRAAKLLAARRFTEASAAYRDLLRRFPNHPSAPLWRARLAASDHANSPPFTTPPPPK